MAPAERLDADMRHVLNVLQSMGGKRIDECRSPEARALPTLDMALRRILRDQVDDMSVGMEMRLIPGPTDEIRARIYVPQNDIVMGLRPMVLFLHGGGFVLGDVDNYDATPRALAARTGAVVVSAHYRQAPEHRFPAAHEDAYAAWTWLLEHAESLGGDARRAAIVGEGSGGNLAVNVALRARVEDKPLPIHLGLVTPMAAMLFDLPSHIENTATFPYSTATLEWAARKLFRKKDEAHDARMNIAGRTDLAGLPPATIILADADPLRSEGEALADALRRSGVWVDMTTYEGVTHGFFGLYRIVNKAMFAQGQLGRNLAAAFGS
ncbi:MAG: alpha/beta hydrolase [Devosia sp.]|nr:alpha/beta hydrolase [Devosia sp.]